MQDSPLHSIFIQIPSNIISELRSIYEFLSEQYENKYPLPNDWNPHIDIFTIRVKPEESNEYISKFNQLNLSHFQFNITLEDFTLSSDHRYIFLELSKEAKQQIFKLRNFINNNIGQYKDLTIPSYFKNNWDRYTEEQKQRIKTEDGPYEYNPHISIIKLNPKDTRSALRDIKKMFKPAEFTVKEIKMNKQTFNQDKMFDTVAVKQL